MTTTKVRITTDMKKLLSCEATRDSPPEVLERFIQWMGDEVEVLLPPLPKPTGLGEPCSSKWFWRVANSDAVENNEGCACFCEHMLDLD